MNFSRLDYLKIALDFVLAFVFFAIFSAILGENPMQLQNVFWAVFITAIFTVRRQLSIARQRIFNLVLNAICVVVMIVSMLVLENSPLNLTAEILCLLYSAYQFYKDFTSKS